MSSQITTNGLLRMTVFLHLILLFPNSASCVSQWSFLRSAPSQAPGAVEEKVRLGSTPPSCRNRCSACEPCTAVEVPTLPGQAVLRAADRQAFGLYSSNYKPLEWKCHCGNRFFNP